MQLKHLRSFMAVAEALHFRRAASAAGLSQPTLSQHIAQLERDVGARLLSRDQRRVQLTPAGEALLLGAQAALNRLDDAAQKARALSEARKNTLIIGHVEYISHAYFPQCVRALKSAYPSAVVEARGMTPAEAIEAVREGTIDLAFVASLDPKALEKLNDLVLREVLKGRWQAIMPGGHPLARRSEVPLQALADEDLILFQRRVNPAGYDWLMQRCDEAGFTARVVQHVSQPQTGLALATEGIGVFLVGSYVIGARPPQTVARPLSGFASQLRVFAAWRPGSRTPLRHAFLSGISKG